MVKEFGRWTFYILDIYMENKWINFLRDLILSRNYFNEGEFIKNYDSLVFTYNSTLKGNTKIIFIVGNNDLLYSLSFYNEETEGFNLVQKDEYFFENYFSETDTYGEPGIKFSDFHILKITNIFSFGLIGQEKKFYQKGELIKSEVQFNYFEYELSSIMPSVTIWHKKIGFFKKITNKYFDQIHSVNLNKIFPPQRF
jgi:hypothetical protein